MSTNSCKIASKQIFCDICRCYIPSDSLVDSHNKGKKHQKLSNISQKRKKLSCCSVFVRGFKKDSDIENDLKAAFCKFGAIAVVYVDKEKCSFAIVQFEDEYSVTDILKSNHSIYIDGHKLVIKPRKQKAVEAEKYSRDSNDDTGNKHEDLLLEETLMNCSSISEQIEKLVEIKQLTTEDIQLRFKLCELLEEIFKEIYSDCEVLPFGSTTTTLGCRGCDLDLTLITANLGICESEKQGVNLGLEGCSKESPDSKTDPSMRSRREIADICEVLRKFAPGCKNVFPLSSAHCPLVKFEHKDSFLHCDLSINNRLAVRNSKLLSSYCRIDDRFRCLSYAIRSWASAQGIAGKSAFQLTKYAWTVMLIHFLQQCDPPVLPCLQERRTGDADECFIDGWDCYYNTEPLASFKQQNSSSLGQLMARFFDYFVNFDWKNDIVCISTQKNQRRKGFSKHLENSGMKNLFRDGPIWMPDPFELTHNIAHNISDEGLKNLTLELRNALDVFMSSNEDCDTKSDCMSSRQSRKEHTQQETYRSSISSSTKRVTVELISGGNSTGKDKYEAINLLNLLKAKEVKRNTRKQKQPKVKFVFYVYGLPWETSKAVCKRCATVVYEILKYDLKMQCSYEHGENHNLNPVIFSGQSSLHANTEAKSTVLLKERNQPKEASVVPRDCDSPTFNDASSSVEIKNGGFLKVSNERNKIGDKTNTGVSKDSAVISEYGITKGIPVEPMIKNVAPLKRSGSEEIGTAAPPLKSQCVMEERNEQKDDFAGSQTEENFGSFVLTVTAWANTWTNRRQQRRMLDSQKWTVMMKTNDLYEEVHGPSYLSEATPSHPSNVSVAHSISAESVAGSTMGNVEESSQNTSFLGTDLQSGARNLLVSDIFLKKPVFIAKIKVTVNEQCLSETRCRVVVKLVEADKLSAFHSFFAFFKKTVLNEMKR